MFKRGIRLKALLFFGVLVTATVAATAPVSAVAAAGGNGGGGGNTVTCPGSGTYNKTAKTCQTNAVVICPGTSSYDPSTGVCGEAPTSYACPAGSSYDAVSGQCVAPATHNCVNGGTYNAANNDCEAPGICPAGTFYIPGSPICSDFSTVQCSSGTFNVTTGMCQSPAFVTCPDGFTYDQTRDACIAPRGAPICEAGFSYNSTLNKCVAMPQYACPQFYAYNPYTAKCESSPAKK